MLTKEMLQKTALALNKMFFATFYCDLKELTYETIQSTEHTRMMLDGIHYLPDAFKQFIKVLVKEEYVEAITEFCNVETIAERLENETYISCDNDSKLEDGWRQVGFLPVEFDDHNKVTHVLFVVRNIEESRSRRIEEDKRIFRLMDLQRKAAQLVSSSEILSVLLIDKNDGTIKLTTRNNDLLVDREYSFDEWVEWERQFVAPIDLERYNKESNFANLKENLEHSNHCKIEFSCFGNNKEYRYVIHHFANLDDGQYYLAVAEDATNWISTDTVTGYINRKGFSIRSQIWINSEKDGFYTMLCFDAQNFKAINSWYGFANGDKVLKEIGQLLQASTLNPILICRESSDTFFCLVESEKINLEEISRICQTHYCLGKLQVPVLLKCGIYKIDNHTENIHMICDKARLACADVVKQTDCGYCYFVNEMKDNYLDYAYILQNYKAAMDNGQIEIFYQPIYETKTKTLASAEALVRWRHDDYGLISPNVFIPTLEQNGKITELDQFVGKKVWTMQCTRLNEKKKMIPIALNVSRHDFRRTDSTNILLGLLRTIPEISKYIRFEITESGFIDITDNGKEFLKYAREMGTKILVDDFGSGYSSLGMLAQFHCDIIKLDMSFAKNIGNNEKAEILLSSIIQVIHRLGLKVIAEGVETQEQYDFFLKNECDYIQGYYFSKPISQDEFIKLLDS